MSHCYTEGYRVSLLVGVVSQPSFHPSLSLGVPRSVKDHPAVLVAWERGQTLRPQGEEEHWQSRRHEDRKEREDMNSANHLSLIHHSLPDNC